MKKKEEERESEIEERKKKEQIERSICIFGTRVVVEEHVDINAGMVVANGPKKETP